MEYRLTEPCSGGTTVLIRAWGVQDLKCFYDTTSGQIVGADHASDVGTRCGADAAAGVVPICDWSGLTRVFDCERDAGGWSEAGSQ
jgi:hypothetical protein